MKQIKYRAAGAIAAVGIVVAALGSTPAARAADPAKPVRSVGPVTFQGKSFTYVIPSRLILLEKGFSLASQSQDYEMRAQTARIQLAAGAKTGGLPVGRVEAEGDPAAGKQVYVHFHSDEESQDIEFTSDRAVLEPDPHRPGQDRIVFTGHVQWKGMAPVALDGPANATMTTATVELGPSPNYPRIVGQDFNGTATPLTGH